MSEISDARRIILTGADGLEKEVREYAHFGQLCDEGLDLIRQGFDKLQAGKSLLGTTLESTIRRYTAISEVTLGSTALEEPMGKLVDFLAVMTSHDEALGGYLQYRTDLMEDEVAGFPDDVAHNTTVAENALGQLRNAADNL